MTSYTNRFGYLNPMPIYLGMVGLFSTLGYGQTQIDSDNAAIQNIFPNAYSDLQVRHYTNTSMNGDETTNIDPEMQARYYLGSTFMNGAVDSQLILGMIKNSGNDEVRQRRTHWVTTLDAYSNDAFSVTPYADIYLPMNNAKSGEKYSEKEGTYAQMGANFATNVSMNTEVGNILLGAQFEPTFWLSSRATTTKISMNEQDAEKFGLVSEDAMGQMRSEKSTSTVQNYYVASGAIKPSAVDGLKLSMGVTVESSFEPKMVPTQDATPTKLTTEQDGYEVSHMTENAYGVSYEINDSVTISNTLYQYYSGLYKSRHNGKRFVNLAKVNVELF